MTAILTVLAMLLSAAHGSHCTSSDYCGAPMPSEKGYTKVTELGMRLNRAVVLVRHGDRTPYPACSLCFC